MGVGATDSSIMNGARVMDKMSMAAPAPRQLRSRPAGPC